MECEISFSGEAFSVESRKEYRPVIMVSWYGAKAFAEYYGLDLPREAEWEYACRGGQQCMYGTDDGTISSSKANYDSTFGHPTDVGSYPANSFGLNNMSGNVWEWCNDRYDDYSRESVTDPTGSSSGPARLIRGGGWNSYARACRSAYRARHNPTDTRGKLGFRVVRRP